MKKLESAVGRSFGDFTVVRVNPGYEGSYLFMIDFEEVNTGKVYTICVSDRDNSDKYYYCEIFRGGEFKLLKDGASLYRLALNLKVHLLEI